MGQGGSVAASILQERLDEMFRKLHRTEPLVVLTALFGQSTSPTAPYSTRSGVQGLGNRFPTNTWRNNFGIQKGVGCPADPDTIAHLLRSDGVRLACPHMSLDSEGRHMCGIKGTVYRGEEHSIWLRMTPRGYQIVDLNLEAVYSPYLLPGGQRIPIFPLIAGLYSYAPPEVYVSRAMVGIPEFAADFRFTFDEVEALFDCDPESPYNANLLGVVADHVGTRFNTAPAVHQRTISPNELPTAIPHLEMNLGVGAEMAVAEDLERHGWVVGYRGNQRGFGYDLEATRDGAVLRIEVKSSIGFCTPELTEAEWQAAQMYGEEFALAVVDFYGSGQQTIAYIRDPAGLITPSAVPRTAFRLARAETIRLGINAVFL